MSSESSTQNSVSIYCPYENGQGTAFGMPLSGKNKFFLFEMTPSGGNSEPYSNTKLKELNGIVTDVYLEKSESISLASTLGSDMFLYVGGASPWTIQVGGYAFLPRLRYKHGFDEVINWYTNENVSKTGGYCTLSLGEQTFRGYLISCQMASVDKEALNLFRFRFKFIAVRIN